MPLIYFITRHQSRVLPSAVIICLYYRPCHLSREHYNSTMCYVDLFDSVQLSLSLSLSLVLSLWFSIVKVMSTLQYSYLALFIVKYGVSLCCSSLTYKRIRCDEFIPLASNDKGCQTSTHVWLPGFFAVKQYI